VEISQYIMIGELANPDHMEIKAAATPPVVTDPRKMLRIPSFNLAGVGFFPGENSAENEVPKRSNRLEDAELVETTAGFADWVASFVRRVILLLENLPEEGVTGNYSGDASESK
jgi:proteasome activator subunit 4